MAKENKEVSVPFLRKITPWDKDGEPGKVKFCLADGQVVIFEMSRASEANQERLKYHGASQKIGDSISGLIKDKLYKAAGEELQSKCELMYSDNWSESRKEGERLVDAAILAKALARFYQKDEAAVLAKVLSSSEEQRKTWATHKKIAAIMMEVRAELLQAASADTPDPEFSLDDTPEEVQTGKGKGK